MFDKDTLSKYLNPHKRLLDELRGNIYEVAMTRALTYGDRIFSSKTFIEKNFESLFNEIWDGVFIPVLVAAASVKDNYSVEKQMGTSLDGLVKHKKSDCMDTALILSYALPDTLFQVTDVTDVESIFRQIKVTLEKVTGYRDFPWQIYIDSFYATYSNLSQYLYTELDAYFREKGALVPDSGVKDSVKSVSKASMYLIANKYNRVQNK